MRETESEGGLVRVRESVGPSYDLCIQNVIKTLQVQNNDNVNARYQIYKTMNTNYTIININCGIEELMNG